MKSAQTFRTEFRDFPADSTAIATQLARGFVDTSWHNSACPSFEAMGLCVWVDFPNPEDRCMMDAEFGICYSGDSNTEEGLDLSFDDFADVVKYLDEYTAEFLALPDWATHVIVSRADAEAFMRGAHDANKLWHLDDSPICIVPKFERAEIGAFLLRREECFEHTNGDPHGYCIFLSRPASWRALDDAMRAKFGVGLALDQRECLDDVDRREECIEMLDDIQARMGIPADVVQAVVIELDGDWQ